MPDDTRVDDCAWSCRRRPADNTSPLDFLNLPVMPSLIGETGEAQEALERAEARALDSAVPLFQTDKPVEDPLVTQIRQARIRAGVQ